MDTKPNNSSRGDPGHSNDDVPPVTFVADKTSNFALDGIRDMMEKAALRILENMITYNGCVTLCREVVDRKLRLRELERMIDTAFYCMEKVDVKEVNPASVTPLAGTTRNADRDRGDGVASDVQGQSGNVKETREGPAVKVITRSSKLKN